MEEGGHVVPGGGSYHTLDGAGCPHTVVDYHFLKSCFLLGHLEENMCVVELFTNFKMSM